MALQDLTMMLPSRLGCPLSLKTPNMGNTGPNGKSRIETLGAELGWRPPVGMNSPNVLLICVEHWSGRLVDDTAAVWEVMDTTLRSRKHERAAPVATTVHL